MPPGKRDLHPTRKKGEGYSPAQASPRLEAELLLESAPVAIVGVDEVGQIIFVNTRLEELFGYERLDLIGQTIECLMPDRFHQIHKKHRSDYTAQPRVRMMGSGMNLVGLHHDGHEFPIEVGLSYVETPDGKMILGSITDISIRTQLASFLEQRVEARTHELNRRQQVADNLRQTLTIINSNRSLEEILDYIVGKAIQLLEADASAIYQLQEDGETLKIRTGQGLTDEYMAESDIQLGLGTTGQAVLTRQPQLQTDLATVLEEGNATTRARRKRLLSSGYHAVLAVPLIVKEVAYGGLTLYYTQPRKFSTEEVDLTITFSDHAALAIENARLHEQTKQTAVTAERDRLARDLHDSVTQTLFSASVIADVLPRLWEQNREEGRRRSAELRELTRGALAEMRTLLLELRPAKLIEIPLKDLLQQLTEAVIGRARVPIELQAEGDCILPPDVQIAFYRIAQEALNNVAKHARASQATVTLNCRADRVQLSVQDNGQGFVLSEIRPKSLGLSIMKERAKTIEATLDIQSETEAGTQVTVSWDADPKSSAAGGH